MRRVTPDVPTILRVFFMIHFFVDIVFAIPLFFIPIRFLEFAGWTTVDPVTARLVAAALFGWLILSEALTLVQAFGGALILFGIWVARPRPRPPLVTT